MFFNGLDIGRVGKAGCWIEYALLFFLLLITWDREMPYPEDLLLNLRAKHSFVNNNIVRSYHSMYLWEPDPARIFPPFPQGM